jgi:ABC-type nitrate/sulfonate/bicarbonate transport system ATPase subunit
MYTKNEVILNVENVSMQYDRLILRDINMCLHNVVRPGVLQGQVVSLIGRSGIGKTQLFKIISGLLKPTTGNVKIGVRQLQVNAGDVGVVPQNYILFNHRTVRQNLRQGLMNCARKYSTKEQDDLINDYASKFDLTGELKKYPMQLSGGQRQRVSILQQVLTGNQFILLDEPFSGLDMLMIDKVINLLVKISTLDEMNTLLIVSHDVENSLAISDTAFVIANEPNKEGATITHTLDLMEMGLAWNPEIKKQKAFIDLVGQIKYML